MRISVDGGLDDGTDTALYIVPVLSIVSTDKLVLRGNVSFLSVDHLHGDLVNDLEHVLGSGGDKRRDRLISCTSTVVVVGRFVG